MLQFSSFKLNGSLGLPILTDQSVHIREAAKKFIFLMAGSLRGGGGRPAGPLRKFFIFLFCCFSKINDILIKAAYQNINTGNVGRGGRVMVF